ncbi:hypothetical protein BSFA1_87160 (plasmid) [Burkholderia sp. SFA1]|nr:hypothetical protein BSFA1_87160 [Burkholderia sp. SFA1]
MPADYMIRITEALSEKNNLDAVFSNVAQAFENEVGYRLLTMSTISHEPELTATRVWSSRPDIFPVGGKKSIDNEEWIDTVLRNRRTLVCETPEALQRMFYDHSDIADAECGSGINVPFILDGEVIGVLNMFHEESWFDEQRVEDARAVLALAYTPIVLARTNSMQPY